jgi:hypothetical protein
MVQWSDGSGMNGYLHPTYAESFTEFGTPHLLPRSGGWILKREIPGFPADHDAMGLYPILVCSDWSRLEEDLIDLGERLITLTVVADPWGNHSEEQLRSCFPDLVAPFKQHFVVEVASSDIVVGSRSHRVHARRALRDVRVERLENPADHLEEWTRLYDVLITRHNISGIAAFSRRAFEKQLQTPGIFAFRALHGDETVGMTLWYCHGDVAYWHLSAYSAEGYRLRASYALFWHAVQTFRQKQTRWLSLGAGAGARLDNRDGLSSFKHGWSTGTRTAYLCGRIFNRKRYFELTNAREKTASTYFPAYRSGEFQ